MLLKPGDRVQTKAYTSKKPLKSSQILHLGAFLARSGAKSGQREKEELLPIVVSIKIWTESKIWRFETRIAEYSKGI